MTATLQENATVTESHTTHESVGALGAQASEHGTSDHEQIQQHFKDTFRGHPAGVSVITADSPSGPVGLTATSVCSVSLNPPAVAFSLSAMSSTAPSIKAAETVVVHLLDSRSQDVAQRFATSGIDRFEGTSWDRLPTGEPLLGDAAAWFRGKIVETVEIGGSTVAVMEIVQAGSRPAPEQRADSDVPLVYCNRTWHGLTPRSEINSTHS